MHAKRSRLGNRFFAHDQKPQACDLSGETLQHQELKAMLAAAVRAAGGRALVEAVPAVGDVGGWRADVLAVGPEGNRVAFEVQLASMTVDEGRARTAKYVRDGIQSVWVTIRPAVWLYVLPSIQVAVTEDGLIVNEGVGMWRDGGWVTWRGQPIDRAMSAWVENRLRPLGPIRISEHRDTGPYFHPQAVVWVARTDADTVGVRLAAAAREREELRTRGVWRPAWSPNARQP